MQKRPTGTARHSTATALYPSSTVKPTVSSPRANDCVKQRRQTSPTFFSVIIGWLVNFRFNKERSIFRVIPLVIHCTVPLIDRTHSSVYGTAGDRLSSCGWERREFFNPKSSPGVKERQTFCPRGVSSNEATSAASAPAGSSHYRSCRDRPLSSFLSPAALFPISPTLHVCRSNPRNPRDATGQPPSSNSGLWVLSGKSSSFLQLTESRF